MEQNGFFCCLENAAGARQYCWAEEDYKMNFGMNQAIHIVMGTEGAAQNYTLFSVTCEEGFHRKPILIEPGPCLFPSGLSEIN